MDPAAAYNFETISIFPNIGLILNGNDYHKKRTQSRLVDLLFGFRNIFIAYV